MNLPPGDVGLLQQLGRDVAAAAADPVNRERADLWTRLNDLDPVRPMVWINELPWHELDVNGELALRCENAWARGVENGLRQTLYQWRHLPGDMVVSDTFSAPRAVEIEPIVPHEDVDIVKTDERSGVVSRRFHAQIVKDEDIEIIRMPSVRHHADRSAETLEALTEILGGIQPVVQTGIRGLWFTPWDNLIRLWGVEQAMMDLVDRPELVNACVERFVACSLHLLDQLEEQRLLGLNNDNTRVGSGGYGYVGCLPGEPFDPGAVTAGQLWGCSNAQIFSEVSPDMHWEFALRHDIPWLERWGLTYYGCCEPLSNKLEILGRVPNLRKISMSPWADLRKAAGQTDGRYVLSHKPNPAVFAEDTWRPDIARRNIRQAIEAADGCPLEIILKDVSTVRYEPQRVWDWAALAMEEVLQTAPA